MNLDALKASLEALKNTTAAISPEQAEEIAVRDAIAAEQARIAEETAKLRQLAIDQAMDEVTGDRSTVEVLDLDAAGFFILKAPAKALYLAYKAKMDKGSPSATDDANLALDCVVSHYVMKTTADGAAWVKNAMIRDVFDDFPLAPTSIGNVGLRLGGFKLQAQAKRGR